jgi:hypothetical protein
MAVAFVKLYDGRGPAGTGAGGGFGVVTLVAVRADRRRIRGWHVEGILVDAEATGAAADLGVVSAARHGATGLVDGGAGSETCAAAAFGGIFDAGEG